MLSGHATRVDVRSTTKKCHINGQQRRSPNSNRQCNMRRTRCQHLAPQPRPPPPEPLRDAGQEADQLHDARLGGEEHRDAGQEGEHLHDAGPIG